ncbi:MAG: PspC domain-containing protein [Microbacterium gubbeenense]|uniref:PspC domain-containing protein n=1 Tax=Microbacterium gubbeenense TaxID=159896 RepID=UPI00048E041B|nr:PspC domain-containing protein [Microbacterium gubbeenense]
MTRQLVRPRRGRMISGVCSAIAQRFNMSRALVRLLTIVGVLFFGWAIPVYVALWIVIPSE